MREARVQFLIPFGSFGDFNPIPTRLCHVIYCHGDNSYPCLVGIGLRASILFSTLQKPLRATYLMPAKEDLIRVYLPLFLGSILECTQWQKQGTIIPKEEEASNLLNKVRKKYFKSVLKNIPCGPSIIMD